MFAFAFAFVLAIPEGDPSGVGLTLLSSAFPNSVSFSSSRDGCTGSGDWNGIGPAAPTASSVISTYRVLADDDCTASWIASQGFVRGEKTDESCCCAWASAALPFVLASAAAGFEFSAVISPVAMAAPEPEHQPGLLPTADEANADESAEADTLGGARGAMAGLNHSP